MARDSRPKKTQNIMLCTEQRAILELISSRTPGQPGLSGLIRHAVDAFINEQAARNPELARDVAQLQQNRTASNVVPIRAVTPRTEGGR